MKPKRPKPKPEPWIIPADCKLPDSIEEIKRGREPVKQRELFDTSTMARLKAIKQGEAIR